MPETSPRLSLPYLQPSQAQKHVTHNEALRTLDALVQMVVQGMEVTTPPALPEAGEIHALGTGANGAWAGQDDSLALWDGTAWTFIPPAEGWRLWDLTTASLRIRSGGAWVLPQADTENLNGVGINTTSDTGNRLAVSSAATLLTHDGAGHQLKINKAAATDTASLLFQTNWSGRAEMGLAGDDNFAVKVSPDGSGWTTALSVDATTGFVGIGTGSADKPLDVSGDGRIDGNLTVTGITYIDGGRIMSFDGGDIGGLVTGSDFGTVFEGSTNGHLVLGIRENNSADSVSILSGGSDYATTPTYDTVVAVFQASGNVGIGVANPKRCLHLRDVLRLTPSATPANPVGGDIYFDSTTNKLRCYDGSAWKNLF